MTGSTAERRRISRLILGVTRRIWPEMNTLNLYSGWGIVTAVAFIEQHALDDDLNAELVGRSVLLALADALRSAGARSAGKVEAEPQPRSNVGKARIKQRPVSLCGEARCQAIRWHMDIFPARRAQKAPITACFRSTRKSR